MPTPRLILASASPQRQQLLRDAGYEFEVALPAVREPAPDSFPDAVAYVTHTAWRKAQDVSNRVQHGIVLAADTVVALEGTILGKARDRDDARRILQLLSGSLHRVFTGVCLWVRPADFWLGGVDETVLQMRTLTRDELEAYLETDRWAEKAGAYAIQDPDPYVTLLRGSHSNVVGLPLELVARLLDSLRLAENT